MKRAFAVIRATVWAATLLLCAAAAAADPPEQVRHELAGTLLHRTVYLRESHAGTYLHYDREGHLVNHVPHGHWTDSGAVYPVKLEVNGAGLLHVEAERMAVAFDQHRGQWTTMRRDNAPVVIEVQLGPALSVEEAKRTAGAIFALNIDQVANDVPAYWRPCVAGELKKDPAKNRMYCFDKGVTPNMESHAPIATDVPHDGHGVSDPKAVETINPRVTEVAREFHFNGSSILWLIVDEQGLPADIYVVSPVGYGLDDEAVTAVARWRFTPAKVKGKPTRAQMTIEVNFKVPLPRKPIGRR